MVGHLVIVGGTIAGMLILFLVISKTLNNIVNQLTKLQYLLEKELELQKEVLTIRTMLAENDQQDAAAQAADNNGKK